MTINELNEIVAKSAEMVKTNEKKVAKLNDYVADSAKKKVHNKEAKYNGTITINKSLCLVMPFDTITIDAIDNLGFDMPTSRQYIHFCNYTNELQIPIEDIFHIFLTDKYEDNEKNYEYDNPDEFIEKLNCLEKEHRYLVSFIFKSVDYDIFDIDFMLN